MEPPKCAICNSQKLFGLCDCEGKRPRHDGQDGKTDKNAKTEAVVLDESTKKGLTRNGLLIDDIVNLK